MEALNEDTLVQSIRQALICPLCETTLTPPLVECKNGHLVCKYHKKSKCPLCATKFFPVPSSFLHRILTPQQHPTLGKYRNPNAAPITRRCKYPGCSQTILIGEDHEAWCEYRPTVCRFDDSFNNCKWSGTVSKLAKHVESSHSGVNVCHEKSLSVLADVSLDEIDIMKHTGWGFSTGTFFWLEVENNAFRHTFTFKVTPEPVRKIVGPHNIWVEITKTNAKFCGVSKLDLDPLVDYRDKNSVTVHTDFLRDVVGEDGKLWFKLDIIKDTEKSFENQIV